MMPQARPMPPAVAWVLTRRVPCALLAVGMFATGLWMPGGSALSPLLALHLLTPALFALIALGGGLGFGLQVALIATVVLMLLTHGDPAPALMLLVLYALLPMVAARSLRGPDGLAMSAVQLAIGLGCATLAALLAGASGAGLTPEAWVARELSPLLEAMTHQQELDVAALERIRHAFVWMFPGMTALTVWTIWWGDVVLARSLAIRHGFFRGDARPFAGMRLSRNVAWLFLALLGVVLAMHGEMRYLAFAILVMVGGLLTAQGLAVAHAWVRARGMPWLLAALYVVLLIQPVMLLPFTVTGLLDTWFDYRRRMRPANGG